MHERTFAARQPTRSTDAAATDHAADLCEQLIDLLSRPGHDWPQIRALTLQLTRIASAMAGPPGGRSLRP